MIVTRLLPVLVISTAMMATAACTSEGSGAAGSGGTAGTAGNPGSAGTGGQGGESGCRDDVGARPAMTGQPSVTPTTIAKGGSATASVPVNAATKYVRAVVFSDFCAGAGRNTVHYAEDSGSDTFYFIRVTDGGLNVPAASTFSDCAEIVPLTITD